MGSAKNVNKGMRKLVVFIREKTGVDEETIKKVLDAEREYFLKNIID